MTTSRELDERYGRARGAVRRRAAWGAGALAAAVAVGALAWFTLSGAAAEVRADDTGFSVRDAHSVSISFEVGGAPGREIACALEALDDGFGVVGWRIVVLPASDALTRSFSETVPTVSLATTGLVNSCWVA